MTNFTSLAEIDDEAEFEEENEDSGTQEPEPLATAQSSTNVPPVSSISEDSSSTSNLTPCPYTKSYVDYPNHLRHFLITVLIRIVQMTLNLQPHKLQIQLFVAK